VQQREAEVQAFEQGVQPVPPANAPDLLVVGLDGGRWQGRQKNPQTGSRWQEDKVATVTTYLPGDEAAERPPQPLVTTYVGTTAKTEGFGKMVQIEAQRRGLRQAQTVLALGDGGSWIDPLTQREYLCDQRIVDYYHAAEHLHDAARAACGRDSPGAVTLAEELKTHLWNGELDAVVDTVRQHSQRLGPPQAEDGPEHPRRVLATNVGYFQKHRGHMDYPRYRKKGWPIGSGVTESGVKQFNKRVKGTEQFWNLDGVEAILALRGLWLSQDDRWSRYWAARPAYPRTA